MLWTRSGLTGLCSFTSFSRPLPWTISLFHLPSSLPPFQQPSYSPTPSHHFSNLPTPLLPPTISTTFLFPSSLPPLSWTPTYSLHVITWASPSRGVRNKRGLNQTSAKGRRCRIYHLHSKEPSSVHLTLKQLTENTTIIIMANVWVHAPIVLLHSLEGLLHPSQKIPCNSLWQIIQLYVHKNAECLSINVVHTISIVQSYSTKCLRAIICRAQCVCMLLQFHHLR